MITKQGNAQAILLDLCQQLPAPAAKSAAEGATKFTAAGATKPSAEGDTKSAADAQGGADMDKQVLPQLQQQLHSSQQEADHYRELCARQESDMQALQSDMQALQVGMLQPTHTECCMSLTCSHEHIRTGNTNLPWLLRVSLGNSNFKTGNWLLEAVLLGMCSGEDVVLYLPACNMTGSVGDGDSDICSTNWYCLC